VTDALAERLPVDLRIAASGGVAVPYVVQVDFRETGRRGQLLEPSRDRVRARRPAIFPAEQRPVPLVVRAELLPLPVEHLDVYLHRSEGERIERQDALSAGHPQLLDLDAAVTGQPALSHRTAAYHPHVVTALSTLIYMSEPAHDLPVSSPAVEQAVELARRGVITHLTIHGERVAAIVPESVIEALRAAEDAEDAAEADAAMDEPGESIPWEQVKAELEL
jgi:antitoxin Phd